MEPQLPEGKLGGCEELIVKLAMRCNIACKYCYWFRDDDVMAKPSLLQPDVAAALAVRLAEHLHTHRLDHFTLLFHGGEPLLFGKSRFAVLAQSLRDVEKHTGVPLRLGMTTNAILMDQEWADLLRNFRVSVSVSIDGPPEIHDRRRVDHKGRGTHARVIAGLHVLRDNGFDPGVLAVCDPATDPRAVLHHLVDELRFDALDILAPDHCHDDEAPSISAYYRQLFDTWFDEYAGRGVRVRYLDAIIAGLLGGTSHTHSIGGGPITSATLLTDGSLEALDTLRTAGTGATRSQLNIRNHPLQAVVDDPLWREARYASTNLPSTCRACERVGVCGGGHIASRWSVARRFDNPSVYCADILSIVEHVWDRIYPTLYYEAPGPLLAEST